MTDEKILTRIQRLLAMSKDVSSPNEAAIAARRAASMMQKHNLEEADVLIKDLVNDDIIDHVANVGYKTIPHWMMWLTIPVAHLMDCEARLYRVGSSKAVAFLGQKDDAQVAAWIFGYLVEQVGRLSKKYRAKMRKQYGGAGHGTNMGDYREGVVSEILISIRELMAEREHELKGHTTGTALVVVKKDLIEQKFGKTKYKDGKRRGVADAGAYYDGREDGKSVRINQAIGSDGAQQRVKKA